MELSVGVSDANQLSTGCVRQGRLHRYGAHLRANVGVVDDDEFACVLERHYSMALESTLQAAGLDDEEIAFVNCVEPTDEDVVSLP